ncbi:hypothetical protein [uncultured Maritimibacter sp.]|uniref:hypothetical protein n=1 Tax=uncultured Maritimibacter sp. TaxID=991866 RepID=UPI002633960E|nr:hypothetical protein [uncultured Maritimibacter sp.]
MKQDWSKPRRRLAPVIVVSFVVALAFVGLCYAFSGFVADDAFIVGRYAMNAAQGLGLVYNPGERVSALTSPLHALIETALAALGLDPVGAYRVLAPVMVLAGWAAVVRLLVCDGKGIRDVILFTIVGLASPFLILWTVGGLETPLLAMLATLFAVTVVRAGQRGAASEPALLALAVLGGLMFITRYDSLLVTGPVLVVFLVREARRAATWLAVALALAIAGGWLIFAQVYYGDIFPTSFYVKFAIGTRPRIDSLSSLLNFLLLSGLVLLVFRLRPGPLSARPALARALLRAGFVSGVLFLLYAARSAGEHMMFGYRMFLPYLMPLALLVVLGLPEVTRRLTAIAALWQAGLIATVLFVGINLAPLTRLPGLDRAYAEYEFVTPRTYGIFMDMLTEDAKRINDHWDASGTGGQPRIYLRTGGTGYWIPDFYVYETLVSYRKNCGLNERSMIEASHYVQGLGFSASAEKVEAVARERADIGAGAEWLFPTTIDWMGPMETGYFFGSRPETFDLGDDVQGNCD